MSAMIPTIKYRCNGTYKYVLTADAAFQTSIIGHRVMDHEFIRLNTAGVLVLYDRYAWDGVSFLPFDRSKPLRVASLPHDGLYQLLRERLLPQSEKKAADLYFYHLAIAKDANPILAKAAWLGVSIRGHTRCRPGTQKPWEVFEA